MASAVASQSFQRSVILSAFMEKLEIQLIFNIDHFREIYYQNGQGNIFKNSLTRNAIAIPIILMVITAVFYLFSFRIPEISWLVGLGFIVIFSTGVYAIIAIIKYKKWKSQIETFLKDIGQHEIYKISITENAIELILGSTTTIDKWEIIKSARIEKNYIFLYKQEGPLFLFASKSMKDEEFEKLKEFVIRKVKQ